MKFKDLPDKARFTFPWHAQGALERSQNDISSVRVKYLVKGDGPDEIKVGSIIHNQIYPFTMNEDTEVISLKEIKEGKR